MTDLSDAALVARVRSGNHDAFGVLVTRYQDRMLAYARYMGFGESESLDVVQEAFVRAYRHIGRCGDPSRFDGWLFKIVSNVCRTSGRRRARRGTEPLEAHRSELVSTMPGPDERLEASSVAQQVRAALDAVSPEHREVLVLMYLQEHSVAEISEMTGASPSAVKMRLKRGREALRVKLAPLFQEVGEL